MRSSVKRFILIAVLGITACLAIFTYIEVKDARVKMMSFSRLPAMHLYNVDSTSFVLSDLADSPLILIYFNSTCATCHYEASVIKGNLKKLEGLRIIFISSEPIETIISFAKQNGLDDYSNIYFGKGIASHLEEIFGTLSTPHIFIYGSDKELRKEFKGETTMETILKYLYY